jgi:acetyltransferase-like isoleucine patch superfamily enzyme
MKTLKTIFKLFIREFITNRVVAFIPVISFRMIFYRKVLKIDIGSRVNIQMGCYIYNSNSSFCIGNNTVINRACVLDRRGDLYIGSNVNISHGVEIYTAGHNINSSNFSDFTRRTVVDDYVWLGGRSIIMPGITIEKGAVVLPGSIVTKDVGSFNVVGGNPAKVIGKRNKNLNYDPSWMPLFQ